MFKVMAATAVFGVIHSALASRGAKRLAAEVVGERNRNGLYRVFYIGQSFATFALLAAYVRRQPSRELYCIRGPARVLVFASQAAAIGYATSAAKQIGIARVLGIESLRRWLQEGDVPPEPEAQGPALDQQGNREDLGPFAWSRHPLNFVPLPIFWLWPRMTTNMLAFNAAATVYLVIGSVHEEARLRDAYGEEYARYQAGGVPFYIPKATIALPAATPRRVASNR
jgi:methanethiol S-methyltransferase